MHATQAKLAFLRIKCAHTHTHTRKYDLGRLDYIGRQSLLSGYTERNWEKDGKDLGQKERKQERQSKSMTCGKTDTRSQFPASLA